MARGLWQSGLADWYGPGTPVVQRVRGYRPNRRGQIKLGRWMRVGLLRGVSGVAACVALIVGVNPSVDGVDRALVCALALIWASLLWRCSLIRVVLRPGEIVRHGVWRHVVVPCSDVNVLHRDSWRGGLVLETHTGETIDFLWFDKSLWDVLYDFSDVCTDAMRSHARVASMGGQTEMPAGLQRRFTWSVGADPLAAAAAICLGLALLAAVRG
ncbi:hypothetical protein GCM10011583_73490 [Streptomyces camponoticapitis]|uniref:PH domain-containing protein n=1 Tax=Streptomyces camponoticapitis TaxID=1616125 RepID=A0ABQ2EXQ2_9ACTN|nr:hypothetical protein [Streptomyces camponoticapitis]GGK30927.1 hypothetical protein GCM10011583_73490 [Streptomyces camponoticapitis]